MKLDPKSISLNATLALSFLGLVVYFTMIATGPISTGPVSKDASSNDDDSQTEAVMMAHPPAMDVELPVTVR